MSAIENMLQGTNLLTLIAKNADVSNEDFEAIRTLNTILQSKKNIEYHIDTIRDIYDVIGKEQTATTRYFNFSLDGQEIEEVNAETYNGDKNTSFEEIPDTL